MHKATLKVLESFFLLRLSCGDLGGLGGVNVLARVNLKIWIRRIAWEVKKRGELGRREFHDEELVRERIVEGVLVGIFLMGIVEVSVVEVGIVLGAIVV